jgi:hypothetical protein
LKKSRISRASRVSKTDLAPIARVGQSGADYSENNEPLTAYPIRSGSTAKPLEG